jgi:hypothetical protein
MNTPDTPDHRPHATARVLTGAVVATIQAEFEEALTDLESTLTIALAHALDAGRRARSAEALAALVPHLEQTERDLLTKNHQLAMSGHEDQAVFTGGIATWREHLTPAQAAVFDAARHNAAHASAALLRHSTAAAAAPRPRKGTGKPRRKRR